MIPRALVVWFGLMVLAILNGIARNSLLSPRIGEQSAHVVSTISLCGLILILTWITNPWIAPGSTKAALGVGLFWFAMTLSFEFLAGHYVFKHTWDKLFADYNLLRGRVWVLVLVTTLLAPPFVERIRGE